MGRRREYVRHPRTGWFDLALGELWDYRDLLGTLVWRNLAVRYKQSAIGIAWAILRPLMQMVVFSVVFGRMAGLPSWTVCRIPCFSMPGWCRGHIFPRPSPAGRAVCWPAAT